jgi:hypothetical protein
LQPSLNDIITTPAGGIALGEMTHRISFSVLNDGKRGWERFGRELLAGVISPMDLLNRLISGDAWHMSFRLSRQICLSAEQRFYFRNSHYAYLPDINARSSENLFKITYCLFAE